MSGSSPGIVSLGCDNLTSWPGSLTPLGLARTTALPLEEEGRDLGEGKTTAPPPLCPKLGFWSIPTQSPPSQLCWEAAKTFKGFMAFKISFCWGTLWSLLNDLEAKPPASLVLASAARRDWAGVRGVSSVRGAPAPMKRRRRRRKRRRRRRRRTSCS